VIDLLFKKAFFRGDVNVKSDKDIVLEINTNLIEIRKYIKKKAKKIYFPDIFN